MSSPSRLTVLVGVLVALGAVPAVAAAQSTPSLPAVVSSSTNWQLRDSLTTGPATRTFTYGTRPLVPIMGDWDGDGTRTAGTYEAGVFKLNNANDSSAPDIRWGFGDPRGFPVAGDFDGDGFDDVAVYRNGLWQVRLLNPWLPDEGDSGEQFSFTYGTGHWPATVPVAGDWDGDGIDGIGTYTLATGTWNLRQTASSGAPDAGTFIYWTGTGSYPVVGDWDGNGTDTVGVKNGTTWALNNENDSSPPDVTFDFGAANDLPLTWKAAPTPRQQCEQELTAAELEAPPNANYILGTPDNDDFSNQATEGVDVICGFGGDDNVEVLDRGDIFLGGAGDDSVGTMEGGTFDGGEGNDDVTLMYDGTFNGGEGGDRVGHLEGGTFNGGNGCDSIGALGGVRGGTFDPGDQSTCQP